MERLRIAGRVAVFSDIHGNLPALEAVLADIRARGAADVICLGDLVGYGPFPNEVAQLVRRQDGEAEVACDLDVLGAVEGASHPRLHRRLCRRLVLFALKFPDTDGGLEAIEADLNLPLRTEGLLSIELVRAAAEKALDIGAPLFAGHLLAASVPWVEGADVEAISDHLLRSAEMYLVAKDLARARTLYEYAEGRIGRKRLLGSRWATVIAAIEGVDSHTKSADDESALTEMAGDIAAAYTTVSRSLRLRQSQSQNNGSESP